MIVVETGSSTARAASPNAPPTAPVLATRTRCRTSIDERCFWWPRVCTATSRALFSEVLATLATVSAHPAGSICKPRSMGAPSRLVMRAGILGFSSSCRARSRSFRSVCENGMVCCLSLLQRQTTHTAYFAVARLVNDMSAARRGDLSDLCQTAASYFSVRTEVRMKSDRPRKPLALALDSSMAFSSGVRRTLTCMDRWPSRAGVGGVCPFSSM